MLQHFTVDHVPQLIECIYGVAHPRTVIAPLSKYVFQAAAKGDTVANHIMREACVKYYKAIKTCYVNMAWRQEHVPVVLAGGVFANNPMLVSQLEQLALDEQMPLHFILPVLEPIGGAGIGAFKMAAFHWIDHLLKRFRLTMQHGVFTKSTILRCSLDVYANFYLYGSIILLRIST